MVLARYTQLLSIACLTVLILITPTSTAETAMGLNEPISLGNSNASFIGETGGDQSGKTVAGAGDVNGDGYDDLLIGAFLNDDAHINAGQVYLIFGRSSGWTMDIDLSKANASFVGEERDDQAGIDAAGVGDVNNDGYDDIVIGAYRNDAGGDSAGQA